MTISHEINLSGLSVCIGIPSTRGFNPLVVRSLFGTKEICAKYQIPCHLAIISGNAVIQWARDEIVDLMLQSDANRFFMIDDDIIWEPEDFMRLLALSKNRDVVCASYPAKREPNTFYIRHDNSAPLVMDEYGLVEVQGVGLGFAIMGRQVVEAVAEASSRVRDEITGKEYASIFQVGTFQGNRRGEDMSFFEAITSLGYKIHLDLSVELGHIGTKVYKGRAMEAFSDGCL